MRPIRALPALLLLPALALAAAAGAAKLPTDEAVRTAMKAVRDLTLNAHTPVTHRRMPPADARTFHARIKAALARIDTETTLAGPARDEIAALARDILAGAAAVAGADPATPPIDGLIAIDGALARYAERFEHPGWQPLR